MVDSTWTIQKVLEWSIPYMTKSSSATPRLDCELLLAHALKCERIDLYVDYFKPLAPEEREAFKSFLKRRYDGEPVAYVLGYRDFWEHRFEVDQNVLIPRPDSEHIIEELSKRQLDKSDSLKILDIGCGSGCLSISADMMLENAQVTAWDICGSALSIAKRNNSIIGASVAFEIKDALRDESWQGEEFDVIISNPPYISQKEIDVMADETLKFEPKKALFAENDGLVFYEKIAERASSILSPNGYIIMEIGYKQAEAVCDLFKIKSWKTEVIQDLSGNDRVVVAHR